jgi:hypothetical protein
MIRRVNGYVFRHPEQYDAMPRDAQVMMMMMMVMMMIMIMMVMIMTAMMVMIMMGDGVSEDDVAGLEAMIRRVNGYVFRHPEQYDAMPRDAQVRPIRRRLVLMMMVRNDDGSGAGGGASDDDSAVDGGDQEDNDKIVQILMEFFALFQGFVDWNRRRGAVVASAFFVPTHDDRLAFFEVRGRFSFSVLSVVPFALCLSASLCSLCGALLFFSARLRCVCVSFARALSLPLLSLLSLPPLLSSSVSVSVSLALLCRFSWAMCGRPPRRRRTWAATHIRVSSSPTG